MGSAPEAFPGRGLRMTPSARRGVQVAISIALAAGLLAFFLSRVNLAEIGRRIAHARGIPVLGAHKGFTTTHQVIADVTARMAPRTSPPGPLRSSLSSTGWRS